jgi:DNA-binding transcriptional LysR family regulator
MNLRLLRYFVAVAELEHVGRAAERLHISQSPLSRQIRQLEARLNLRLFDRERQRVRLTNAGRWFHREALSLLARAKQLESDAGRIGRGETGTFSVGFVKAALWNDLLPDALRRLRALRPELQVALHNLPSTAQIEALQRRELDVCLVHVPPKDSGLTSTCILKEPLVLAVPKIHSLARRKTIRPKDLDGAPWISPPRAQFQESYDRLLAACSRAGFSPLMKYEAIDPSTTLALVGAGLGLAFVESSLQRFPHTGVNFHNLAWFPLRTRIHLVRNLAGLTPVSQEFIRIVCANEERRQM